MAVYNCEHRLHSGYKNNRQFCSVKTSNKPTKAIERRCVIRQMPAR